VDVLEKDGAVEFLVRVLPRASRSELVGQHDGALKIKIASPPVDGAANEELIKLLAKIFGARKADVEIIGGQTSRSKRIRIDNLSRSRFEEIIK
jgi:uncharacterized protein (TIGR00251 family)